MAQVDGDLVAVSKSCSWPAVGNGSIDSVLEVLLEEGSDSSLPESISWHEDAASGVQFPRPSADSAPFEITVAFQRRVCHIRSIYILSSARTCEIYSQQAGSNDVEYVCTARGELFELSDKDSAVDEAVGEKVEEAGEADAVVAEFLGSTSCSQLQQVVEGRVEETKENAVADEPFYEIEVELVNSHAWAAVKLRLLSLHDRMVINIKKVIVSVQVGSSPNEAVDSSSSTTSSLMAMLMPTMLQMMRSGSRAGEQTSVQNVQQQLSKPETRPSAVVRDNTTAATVAPSGQQGPQGQGQDFQNEIRSRLENLETICSRMESYLHIALSKLDDRVGNLEIQIRTMQEQSLVTSDSSSKESSDKMVPIQEAEHIQVSPREEQEQEDEPEDLQQIEPEDVQQIGSAEMQSTAVQYSEPVLPKGGVAAEEANHDMEAGEQSQEDEAEDMQQMQPEDIVPVEKHSISLDDAWVSALTAFSSSTSGVPAQSRNSYQVDTEPVSNDVLVPEVGSLIDAELRSQVEGQQDERKLCAEILPDQPALDNEGPPLLDLQQKDGADEQLPPTGGTTDLTVLLGSLLEAADGETSNEPEAEILFGAQGDESDLVFRASYEQRDEQEESTKAKGRSSSTIRPSVEDSLLELTPEL